METEASIKAVIRELMDTRGLAVLSTEGGGQPYGSLVAFTGSDDLKHMTFATPRSTRKFANIEANPRVALLVNSSENTVDDYHRAACFTATGSAVEIGSDDIGEDRDNYLSRHPYLKSFVDAPTTALVRVTVDCYHVVHNFQTVTELHVNQ